MVLLPDLLSVDDLRVAVAVELDAPPRQLPPSRVHPALQERRDEVAQWAHGRIQGEFVPTPEIVVAVNKPGHGVRPVAVWDFPSRLAYWALAQRLRPALPPVDRSRAAWTEFQRAPAEAAPKYIVSSDIAACYQFVDHTLLSDELLVQTGDTATVSTIIALLQNVSTRRYGLPQQSWASDLLAEAFLCRLERALIRKGLRVFRYNDDFRFACVSWHDAVRSMEILAEEARSLGLTVNDLKTVTWTTSKYVANLDRAESLRAEIAAEGKLNLKRLETEYDTAPLVEFSLTGDTESSATDDVLASLRVLERWDRIAGRARWSQANRPEHRAVVELLPAALKTLESDPETDPTALAICMKILRYERTVTPAVASYLLTRNDETAVLTAFNELLAAKAYLNGWQTWWLQEPLSRLPGFADGPGSSVRRRWAQNTLKASENSPVLGAHAALTLAQIGLMNAGQILTIYDRSNTTLRPVLAAALAFCRPDRSVAEAVRGDSVLHAWIYDWAANHA